jgi:hypothetical protein
MVQGDQTIAVRAGYIINPDDPDPVLFGGVMVDHFDLRGKLEDRKVFPAPTRAGALHVVSADELRVTLLADNGTTFVFDAATSSWEGPSAAPNLSSAQATATIFAIEQQWEDAQATARSLPSKP